MAKTAVTRRSIAKVEVASPERKERRPDFGYDVSRYGKDILPSHKFNAHDAPRPEVP